MYARKTGACSEALQKSEEIRKSIELQKLEEIQEQNTVAVLHREAEAASRLGIDAFFI